MSSAARATILVVPGFGDSSRSWRTLLGSPLADHHHVELVDLPGIGIPSTGAAPTIEAHAAHLARLVVAGGAGRPAFLVGHSLGSAIAVEAIRSLEGAVAGLVSLEGNLTTDDGYFSATAAVHADASTFRTALLDRVDDLLRSGEAPASYLASIEAADPVVLWEIGRDASRLGAGDGFGEAFRAVGVPTLYLWSARSTPVTTQRYLAAHGLAAARNDDATHWPLEHARAWVTDQIDRFVQVNLERPT